MTTPTWSAIRDAIQAAIASASGLAADHVIWSAQNANQPLLPYISIAMHGTLNPGQDSEVPTFIGGPAWATATTYHLNDLVEAGGLGGNIYKCAQAGTSAGAGPGPTGTGVGIVDGTVKWNFVTGGDAKTDVQLDVRGLREATLAIEVYTASVDDSNDALAIADAIRTNLRRESIRSVLRATGVCPFDIGPSQFVPAIVAVGFRGRAIMDVRCWVPITGAIAGTGNRTGYIAEVAGMVVTAHEDADGDNARTITVP